MIVVEYKCVASIVLIAIGPWVISLVIEFPSPFLSGRKSLLNIVTPRLCLGLLKALTCIVHLYRLLSRIRKNQVFYQTESLVYALSGLGVWIIKPSFLSLWAAGLLWRSEPVSMAY